MTFPKYILIFVLCLFSYLEMSGQDSIAFHPEWSYGVNAGVTLSKISFNPKVNQDYLQQYVGGVMVRYISEKNIGVQAELNYSMRGWKERTDTLHLNKYSRSLAYLELPLMTHFYANAGKRARVVFNVGAQISYLLSEKSLGADLIIKQGETLPPYYDTDLQKKFDYGLIGGMGFELRTGIGSFSLEGRYYFGLSDTFNSTKADYFSASSNQVINLKLAYLIRSSK